MSPAERLGFFVVDKQAETQPLVSAHTRNANLGSNSATLALGQRELTNFPDPTDKAGQVMRTYNSNSVPDLAELKTRLIKKNDSDSFNLNAELRINVATFTNDEDLDFTVEINTAVLNLMLEGCEILMGLRYGEALDSDLTHTEVIERTSSHLGAQTRASINLTATEASLSASADAKAIKDRSKETKMTEVHRNVTARPNNKWEIKPYAGPLKASYLTGETLCEIQIIDGANRFNIICELSARTRDIEIRWGKRNIFRKEAFKAKLMKAFVAKTIHQNPDEFRGKILLSRSTCEII